MLLVAAAALLLAFGLAACGGGDSGSTSSETEATAQEQAEGGASGGSSQSEEKNGGKKGTGAKEGKSAGSQDGGGKSGSSTTTFVPKHHTDSGGGSAKFVKKGGDNSVQEFGGEADTSEFEAAATVLHNFLDARAAGAWDAACGYIAQTAREGLERLASQAKQLAGAGCGGILEALTTPEARQAMQAEAEGADARSLRFEGEQGFLLYTVEGTVYSMPMNKEGDWKVASLAGSPLP